MKILNIILPLCLIVCVSFPLFAQTNNILPPKKVKLIMEVAAENPPELLALLDETPEDHLDAILFDAVVVVGLFNLSQLEKIHVKLGESPGASNFGEQTFVYDPVIVGEDATANPNFYRSGQTLFFRMGRFTGDPKINVEVILESKAGLMSSPEYYIPYSE